MSDEARQEVARERLARRAAAEAASPALRALRELKSTAYWTNPDAVMDVWRMCLLEGIADDAMLQTLTFGYESRDLFGRLVAARDAFHAERVAAE